MSEHKTLAAALLAFQQNPPHVPRNGRNPAFKSSANRDGSPYATLDDCLGAIVPALNEQGIVLSQPLSHIDGAPALKSILIHADSGERIEELTPLLLDKMNSQGHGSAITYAKRYGLLAVTGLNGDDDDDGNAASGDRNSAPTPTRASGDAPPTPDAGAEVEFAPELPYEPSGDGITEKQNAMLGRLVTKLTAAGVTDVDAVRAYMDAQFGKTSRTALTKKEASVVIEWLVEMEKAAA